MSFARDVAGRHGSSEYTACLQCVHNESVALDVLEKQPEAVRAQLLDPFEECHLLY